MDSRQANRPTPRAGDRRGRYTAVELDELLLAREQAVLQRRRVRRAHAYVLPDVAEIRPQLAADIAGDDFAGEPLAEYGA